MITQRENLSTEEREHLQRAIELANHARESGNPPFGALLADSAGTIVHEAWNTTLTDRDITAHAELKVARWVGREMDVDSAALMTVYASCQPCGMCVGAMERVGVGKAIFAISHADLASITSGLVRASMRLEGPMMVKEGLVPLVGYYN